jgi:hypothetical protein
MGKALDHVSPLTRREIEARIAGPLIRAFMEQFGRDETLAVVRKVIKQLARESGILRASQAGGNSLADFAKSGTPWEADGALEKEVLEFSDTKYDYNIIRCQYAEMYKNLGMQDLGQILSCCRDFDMVQGFNSMMKLVRTKTIMDGHDHCDFRIILEKAEDID